MVPGRWRSTVACCTQDRLSMRARAASSEKPSSLSPTDTPRAARSSGSGVLVRPSTTTWSTRSPANAPMRSRSEATVLAGCTLRAARATAATTSIDARPQASGRNRRRWRRRSNCQRVGRSPRPRAERAMARGSSGGGGLAGVRPSGVRPDWERSDWERSDWERSDWERSAGAALSGGRSPGPAPGPAPVPVMRGMRRSPPSRRTGRGSRCPCRPPVPAAGWWGSGRAGC